MNNRRVLMARNKRKNKMKRQIQARSKYFEHAWAAVAFSEQTNYTVLRLFASKNKAQAFAHEETEKSLDSARYKLAPLVMVFAVPVEGKHQRGVFLYPALCSSNDLPDSRTLQLFSSLSERAAALAQVLDDDNDDEKKMFDAGEPVRFSI